MNLDLKLSTFITFIIIGIFFIDNAYLGGYLGDADYRLHHEIGAPEDALYEWNLAERPPFQYRVLFPLLVKGSWQMLPANLRSNNAFYITYKAWSLLFLITSVLSLYWLLRTFGFTEAWSFAGCFLYMVSAPILLAYSLPVHTREDTLAYTLLCLGLICLARQQVFALLLTSILGVFCRETLLLLPFIWLFFYHRLGLLHRILLAALPVATWVMLRLWLHDEGYAYAAGLQWNMQNPWQVVGFTFVTFGFLWLPFLYGLIKKDTLLATTTRRNMSFLYDSGWAVLLLIMVSTFLGGMFNEIRLVFLLFPWVIGISVHVLGVYAQTMHSVWKDRTYRIYAALNVLLFLMLTVWGTSYFEQQLDASEYAIRFDVWIVMTFFNVLMTLLFLPIFFKFFKHAPHIGDKFAS